MDILSAIKDYISYANIVADNPKELIPKSISERALGVGETTYLKTVGHSNNQFERYLNYN